LAHYSFIGIFGHVDYGSVLSPTTRKMSTERGVLRDDCQLSVHISHRPAIRGHLLWREWNDPGNWRLTLTGGLYLHAAPVTHAMAGAGCSPSAAHVVP